MNTFVGICNRGSSLPDVEVPVELKGRRFRINAKRFFLTYSQVRKNFPPAEGIEQLQKIQV